MKTLKKRKQSTDFKENSKKLTYQNLYQIIKIAKKNNYVLLGESTHGTEEFFMIRLVITMILIKDFGFNTVLFETEWSTGYRLNQFIHSDKSEDIKKLLNNLIQSFPKWMVNNVYIMKLLLFLKEWNQSHDKKVFFYGVDCQNVELAKENVCHEKNINCSLVKEIIENYNKMNQSKNYWNMRDKFWLHIIHQLKKQRESKFVLWAHNSHIGDCKANTHSGNKVNIGHLLNNIYPSYRIGFSTYQGSVKASKGWNKPGKKYSLKKAHEDSFEHIFHLLSKSMKTNSIIYECDPSINIIKLFRYVGVVYDSDNEMDAHYVETDLNKEFNVVIFINKTTFLKQSTDLKSISSVKNLKKMIHNI